MSNWDNLAHVVYKRTYARKDNGSLENWDDTVERVIRGNTRNFDVSDNEKNRLRYFLKNRKASPGGRGLWFSGASAGDRLGGAGLVNCWAFSANQWYHFVLAQDMLMQGGGVGLSVEHRFVSKLPKVKNKEVVIKHKNTKDADFIVPDSREGWNELLFRTLESFFLTGKSFTYSTICIRPHGQPISGFGGVASGPEPLIKLIDKLCSIFNPRQGKHLRPIDCADILCSIGEMVVAGNVRRSAIIILGDPWDKEYLRAKRWDLHTVPSHRAMANFSVVCDDYDDLHPSFWKTYEFGEPFGIINRTNIQTFGRMGEYKNDTATLVNPCGEATLENGEPCNLQEIALPNLSNEAEFIEAATLMHRYGKRVTLEHYKHDITAEVIARNRRVGTGITGCLMSELFNPKSLDAAYAAIQIENVNYSKELNIPESIRTTLIKPSGTMSKVLEMQGYEGIHAAYSRHFIQRVRFSSSDPLIPALKKAGHHIEPVVRIDGTLDHQTLVVDFYQKAPEGHPVADEDWDTWKQLDKVKEAQKHWADQSISVTVYYKKNEISKVKDWVRNNLDEIKTVSFLAHSEHGFRQAPKETITEQQYDKLASKIKPISQDIEYGNGELEGLECEGGVCPVR